MSDSREHADQHEQWLELAALAALDALPPEEMAEFEAQVANCAACRAAYQRELETAVLLSEGLDEAPSAGLRDRVLEQAALVAQDSPQDANDASTGGGAVVSDLAAAREQRAKRVPRWVIAVAAAAALALGAVAVTQWWPEEDVPLATQIVESDDAVTYPVTPADDSTSVVVSEELGRAVLRAPGLEELPEGSVYQAWFIGADGEIASAGLAPSPSDAQEWVLEGEPAPGDTVGITVEPQGGSPQPTTEPILAIPLS